MVSPMRTSRKALASLLLGSATLFMGLLTGASQSLPIFLLCIFICLMALILGILGRWQVAKSESELQGKGLASCGIGMSLAGPILGLIFANMG